MCMTSCFAVRHTDQDGRVEICARSASKSRPFVGAYKQGKHKRIDEAVEVLKGLIATGTATQDAGAN